MTFLQFKTPIWFKFMYPRVLWKRSCETIILSEGEKLEETVSFMELQLTLI
jgi:hypothetical protein